MNGITDVSLSPAQPDLIKSHSSSIRVLLVDDHKLFLAGIRALLQNTPGFTIVAEATNRAEALDAARAQPDIVLLDLDLGEEFGLNFLPDLIRIAESSKVIVVTGLYDPEINMQAVRLGAAGIVFKLEGSGLFLKAIRKVHAGEVWLNRSMMAAVLGEFSHSRPTKPDPDAVQIASLTSRELEVIAALGEGRRNKQIAERLFISEKTVRHYLTTIFDKLSVKDRLELIIYAYRHGLAKIPVSCASSQRKIPQATR